MTTSYKELLFEHEQAEKALENRAIRSFSSCFILPLQDCVLNSKKCEYEKRIKASLQLLQTNFLLFFLQQH